MEPLLNDRYWEWENIGTVVFLEPFNYRPIKNHTIGEWRKNHPEHQMRLVYGVYATVINIVNASALRLAHGDILEVSHEGQKRFYQWTPINLAVDELWIPKQIVLDWNEQQQMPRQLHLPDMKWFEPNYSSTDRRENFTTEQLGAQITRRLQSFPRSDDAVLGGGCPPSTHAAVLGRQTR